MYKITFCRIGDLQSHVVLLVNTSPLYYSSREAVDDTVSVKTYWQDHPYTSWSKHASPRCTH